MKLFLVVVGLVVAVSAYEPINNDYHNTIGVYEAARIKQAEEAADFDGNRITGGNIASLGQFPYQAGLLIRLQDGRQSVCGASLISNTRLVTAAHCWVTFAMSAHTQATTCGLLPMTLPSSSSTPLATPTTLGILVSQVEAICTSDHGLLLQVFGRYADNSGVSTSLRHVNLQVITNDVCRRTYGSTIIASIICVATPNGRSTCGGDSGGPLAISNTLIGVVSFGHRDGCTRDIPPVSLESHPSTHGSDPSNLLTWRCLAMTVWSIAWNMNKY
ncbi:unnamed protein product [Danaus chrysippus]|uniref:(African queen) hypothetical protein n=1 Tax=Danaus chrysippus TaxID=151541 RepID=A0A8J2QMY5_9NEOP|nr:unnamed protein product [Danaus chrysippus]